MCDERTQNLLQVCVRFESVPIIDLVSLFECNQLVTNTAFICVDVTLIKLRQAILKQFGRCAFASAFARPGVNRTARKGWE